MKGWSIGQLRALSNFFNMVAVAWLSASVISLFVAGTIPTSRSLALLIIGSAMTYFCLEASLYFVEEVDQ